MTEKKPLPPYLVAKAERKKAWKKANMPPSLGTPNRAVEIRKKLKALNIVLPRGAIMTPHMLKSVNQIKTFLKRTWSDRYDKHMPEWTRLTGKQIAFCKHHAALSRASKMEAMRKAGYEDNDPEDMRARAANLLKRPSIEALIQAFELEGRAQMKLTVEEVVDWFKKIATDAMAVGDFTNANRAMENLGKYLQMFTEKREITHRVIHSQEDLDTRIAELTAVLREVEPEINKRLNLDILA